MRKKLIGFIILLIALSLLTLGLINGEYTIFGAIYEQMTLIP
ncbi:MAG: hypothetical protein ACFFA8_06355 [Promethearchaeota archaeon]